MARRGVANLKLRSYTPEDLDKLTRLSRQLVEDEGHRNRMTLSQLRKRIGTFLQEGWLIDIFEVDGKMSGYAVHRYEEDVTEESGRRVRLRQFFIAREARQRGLGRLAVAALQSSRWSPGDRVTVNVLEANPGGLRFWKRIGFVPYARTLETHVGSLQGPDAPQRG
jgi:GNAT superfamily N-acetyltransferase